MINIPIKDYQFSGLFVIIGLIIWGLSGTPLPHQPVNFIVLIGFVMGSGMVLIGTLATLVLFFLGENVRFKQ